MIVGVNKFQPKNPEQLDILEIDNQAVRLEQIEKLSAIRASRNENTVSQALDAVRKGAQGTENLLELCVTAMRARASVGEVLDALSDVFSRYSAKAEVVSGVYEKHFNDDEEFDILSNAMDTFKQQTNETLSFTLQVGQDGHDRGAKVIASAFQDFDAGCCGAC